MRGKHLHLQVLGITDLPGQIINRYLPISSSMASRELRTALALPLELEQESPPFEWLWQGSISTSMLLLSWSTHLLELSSTNMLEIWVVKWFC